MIFAMLGWVGIICLWRGHCDPLEEENIPTRCLWLYYYVHHIHSIISSFFLESHEDWHLYWWSLTHPPPTCRTDRSLCLCCTRDFWWQHALVFPWEIQLKIKIRNCALQIEIFFGFTQYLERDFEWIALLLLYVVWITTHSLGHPTFFCEKISWIGRVPFPQGCKGLLWAC